MPAYPQTPMVVKEWKVKICQSVQAASGRADNDAWKWKTRAAQSTVPYDELGIIEPKFITLDRKLGYALTNTIPAGSLRTKITNSVEKSVDDNLDPTAGI